MKKTISTNAFNSVSPPHGLAVNQLIYHLNQDATVSPASLNGRNSTPPIEQSRLPKRLGAGSDLNETRLYSEAAVALQGAFSRGRENTFRNREKRVVKITLWTGR